MNTGGAAGKRQPPFFLKRQEQREGYGMTSENRYTAAGTEMCAAMRGALNKAADLIRQKELIRKGDLIAAGVSGGADSVLLFHLLLALREEMGFDFFVVHVHHGLRGKDADGDEAFTEALCRRHGILYYPYFFDVAEEAKMLGMSVEEAGREVRRGSFLTAMQRDGATKIALAHHRDDVAETVLLNLARGTGIAGAGSMRPAGGIYIRPLLTLSREEIETALSGQGIEWREDATNADRDATRNRLRLDVLPYLKEYVNGQAAAHLSAFASDAAEISDLLAEQADRLLSSFAAFRGTAVPGLMEALLPAGMHTGSGEFLCGMAVHRALIRASGRQRDWSRRHVDAVMALFTAETGKQVDLPYGLRAERTYEGILIAPARGEVSGENGGERGKEIPLAIPGTVSFGGWRITAEFGDLNGWKDSSGPYTKWFDYDKIQASPVLRHRRDGDRIAVYPDGRTKSLSDYLTDAKVPQKERDGLVLLAAGEEILWILGDRTGESARIGSTTGKAVCVTAYEEA